jgi:hypothetical protein
VIFMHRSLEEVVRSQTRMLQSGGQSAAPIPPERMVAVFAAQIASLRAWLAARPVFEVSEFQHSECVRDPQGTAARMNQFLGGHLDEARMGQAVDPTLHRNKGQG